MVFMIPSPGMFPSHLYRRKTDSKKSQGFEKNPPSVPNLDRRWEEAILRCLEREPARRFESLSSLVRSLKAGKKKPRFVPAIAIPTALIVAAVIALILVLREPSTSSDLPSPGVEPTAFQSRRSIAVLGFKNLAGRTEAAWLSTALS